MLEELDTPEAADFNFHNKSDNFIVPKFSTPLHVGSPNTGDINSFLSKVKDIFDKKWFTNNGEYVQTLELRLQEFLRVKHCILVNNATIGLDILGRALGLQGEVIVPSFTFIASAHSLLWQNITPVFCDVDPLTHNIDPAEIEKLITPKTSAIMGVHVWGRPCDINLLSKIAKKHGIKLFFDAAHAFACSYQNEMIGNFGEAEVFSFHATKFFNTFEGGAVATNCDELASKIRLMRNFGFAGPDSVVSLGTNGKMSEISAAMGLNLLDDIEELRQINYQNYLHYKKLFDEIPGCTIIKYDEQEKNNYQYIIAEIDSNITGFSRDDLVKFLHQHNVLVRRYFYPGCHQMQPYAATYAQETNLQKTVCLSKKVISFPNGSSISTNEIDLIAELISDFSKNTIKGA